MGQEAYNDYKHNLGNREANSQHSSSSNPAPSTTKPFLSPMRSLYHACALAISSCWRRTCRPDPPANVVCQWDALHQDGPTGRRDELEAEGCGAELSEVGERSGTRRVGCRDAAQPAPRRRRNPQSNNDSRRGMNLEARQCRQRKPECIESSGCVC